MNRKRKRACPVSKNSAAKDKMVEKVLPLEMWARVFVGLDVGHRIRFKRVCKDWNDLMQSKAVSSVIKINLTALSRSKWREPYSSRPIYGTDETKTIIFTTDLSKHGWTNWEDFYVAFSSEWENDYPQQLHHVLKCLADNCIIDKVIFKGLLLDYDHFIYLSYTRLYNKELVFVDTDFGDIYFTLYASPYTKDVFTRDCFGPVNLVARNVNASLVVSQRNRLDYDFIFKEAIGRFAPELSDTETALANETLKFNPGWRIFRIVEAILRRWIKCNPDKVPNPLTNLDIRVLDGFTQRELLVFAHRIYNWQKTTASQV